ncbi:hypothetical protein EDD16DRAFT_1229339 [Pisolithus croceorrhizus]|nr:hypothetical protein EDD16DRAFT_1229339 [Pisolithus croceorrhizus]KAI6120073.1 hypothetical protein EV401DRAFT_2070935 [Pisolithus croceorrhizus]
MDYRWVDEGAGRGWYRVKNIPSWLPLPAHVRAPHVKESAFSMEYELLQAIDITHPVSGQITTTMILAHVKYIHLRNDVPNECGVIDIAKYIPVARLRNISHGRLGDVFGLPRSVWRQEKEKIEQVLEIRERREV